MQNKWTEVGPYRHAVDLYEVFCDSDVQTKIGKLKLGALAKYQKEWTEVGPYRHAVDLYEVFCDSDVQTKIGKLKLGALAKCQKKWTCPNVWLLRRILR